MKVLVTIVLVARSTNRLQELASELSSRPHPIGGTYLDALLRTLRTSGDKKVRDIVAQMLAQVGVEQRVSQPVLSMSRNQKLMHAARVGVPAIGEDVLDQLVASLPWLVGFWALSHLVGIGELLDLIGLAFLGRAGVEAVGHIIDFYNLATEAQNEGDLRAAGAELAAGLSILGVTGLLLLLGVAKRRATRRPAARRVMGAPGDRPPEGLEPESTAPSPATQEEGVTSPQPLTPPEAATTTPPEAATTTSPEAATTAPPEAATSAPAPSFAEQSGVLRGAARGKGNFGLGSATKAEADTLGRAWVGEGYRVAGDAKTLVSRNGLRQYRPPSFKPKLGRAQANFEHREPGQSQWQGNGHLDITDWP